jgi:hypothetical protein
MPDDTDRFDDRGHSSWTQTVVTIAAAAIALMGLTFVLTGLQALMLIQFVGLWKVASIALMVYGVGVVVAAKGYVEARRVGAWAGLVLSALAIPVSGTWVLLTFLGGVVSLLGPIAFACSIAALVLAILGFGPCLRAARAAAEMAAELDAIGAGSPTDEPYALGAEPREAARAGRRHWAVTLFKVIAVALVATVIVMIVLGGSRARITRVVVVPQGGIDPAFDSTFVELFREALEERGLDAVASTSPIAADTPIGDAAREVMRETEAAHAVVLRLSSERVRDGVVPSTALFAVELAVQLVPEDAEAAPGPSDTMGFAFERVSAGEVFRFVHETWIDAEVPWVLDALFRSPGFEEVLEGQVDFDEATFASKLKRLEDGVARRRKAVQAFDDFCRRERERLDVLSRSDARPVRCVGDPCGQVTLIGVDAQGRGIAQDISRRPIFGVPPASRGAWAEPPERIVAVTLSGEGSETELTRAGHYLGFGHVSPDGRFAAVQPFGDADFLAVLVVDLSTGARHDVTLLRSGERTSLALPAPDGLGAAVVVNRDEWAFVQGSRRVGLPSFRTAAWVRLDEGLRLVGQLHGGELALVSPDGAMGERWPVLEGWLEAVFAASGGVIPMLVRVDDACDIVRVSARDLTVSDRTPLPTCLDDAAMLPDGRLVGTADVTSDGDVPGDPEVVVLDPASASVTPLTSGGYLEEAVFPTPDGSRVVFGRRLEEWPRELDLGIYRRVVCWVDVPPR